MDLDRIKYWSDLSDYDMETAEAMFSTGRWLYVGYMCHQGSDIDVAVVVPEVKDDFLKASSLLWSLTWEINSSIEPVLIDQRYPSPLYEDIIKTGILV